MTDVIRSFMYTMIATKLAKKMVKKHTAGQLLCNAHIALV